MDGEWVDGWMDGWSVVISCWLFYNQFPVLKHFLQCPSFALDVSDQDWLQDQVQSLQRTPDLPVQVRTLDSDNDGDDVDDGGEGDDDDVDVDGDLVAALLSVPP